MFYHQVWAWWLSLFIHNTSGGPVTNSVRRRGKEPRATNIKITERSVEGEKGKLFEVQMYFVTWKQGNEKVIKGGSKLNK